MYLCRLYDEPPEVPFTSVFGCDEDDDIAQMKRMSARTARPMMTQNHHFVAHPLRVSIIPSPTPGDLAPIAVLHVSLAVVAIFEVH